MEHIKEDINKYTRNFQNRSLIGANLPVRPSKGKKTRLFLDNEFFRKGYAANLPKGSTDVYAVLAMYANQKKQTCFPSIGTITLLSNVKNRNKVIRIIKILEEYNLIFVVRSPGKKSNFYSLLRCEVWNPPPEKKTRKNNQKRYQFSV
jgi:hypothetical protein